MNNKNIIPANTDEYQHHLCEMIIKYLYGDDANIEYYKVYHRGQNHKYDFLKGVDITKFDYTTEKHLPNCAVEYDDKVADALKYAKFGKKYGDLHMHDEGDSMFKAIIESRAYKNLNTKKSVLCIYPK